MKVRLTSRHFDVTPDFRAYVEDKVSRLARYFDRVDEAHVVFEEQGRRRIADVTVHAAGVIASSERETEDMRSAFDRAFEKVERQIRRHKDRVRDHKHGEGAAEAARISGGTPPSAAGAVIAERLPRKSMTSREAVEQMDEMKVPFLLFRNVETDKMNVIYKRDDGNYGLIEPED